MIKKRIKNVFPNVITTGAIMTAIANVYPDYITSLGLTADECLSFDIFYLSMSGERPISGLMEMMTDANRLTLVTDDGQRLVIDDTANLIGVKGLITLDSDTLAKVIYDMFNRSWSKVVQTFSYKYSPIKPFSMSVTETGSTTKNSSNTNTSSSNDKGEGGNTYKGSDENTRSSFDSEAYQPDHKSESSSSSTNTHDNTKTGSWGGTAESKGTNSRSTERSGNIGNISTQELLEKERELYVTTFFDTVKRDLDRVLTLPIYN